MCELRYCKRCGNELDCVDFMEGDGLCELCRETVNFLDGVEEEEGLLFDEEIR